MCISNENKSEIKMPLTVTTKSFHMMMPTTSREQNEKIKETRNAFMMMHIILKPNCMNFLFMLFAVYIEMSENISQLSM